MIYYELFLWDSEWLIFGKSERLLANFFSEFCCKIYIVMQRGGTAVKYGCASIVFDILWHEGPNS